jgi:hypothetical protein
MKNILSKTKTAIILLIVTVLLTGSYVYLLTCPIAYGMKYRNETVYEGEVFKGSLKYSADGKVISENTNFDEPLEMYYYYKDGYVFNLVAKNDAEYEAEVAYINENFDEALAAPFYAVKTNAFKQVPVGFEDDDATIYTCKGAIIFAIVGGIDRLLLIALTVSSFVLSKKAKNKEQI